MYNKKFEELIKNNQNRSEEREEFEADILDELTPHNQIEDNQEENIDECDIEHDFQAQEIAFSQNNLFLSHHQNENYSVQHSQSNKNSIRNIIQQHHQKQ